MSLGHAHQGKSPGCAERGHNNLVLLELLQSGNSQLALLNPGVGVGRRKQTLLCAHLVPVSDPSQYSLQLNTTEDQLEFG